MYSRRVLGRSLAAAAAALLAIAGGLPAASAVPQRVDERPNDVMAEFPLLMGLNPIDGVCRGAVVGTLHRARRAVCSQVVGSPGDLSRWTV